MAEFGTIRDRLLKGIVVFLDVARRPDVAVHHSSRAKNHGAADASHGPFRPVGAQRKAMTLAGFAAAVEGPDDCRAGDDCKDPAAGPAQRPERTATDQREGFVKWGDGLAACDQKRGATPDQQAAECDDEGRDAQIGDQAALKGADQCPHRDPRRPP